MKKIILILALILMMLTGCSGSKQEQIQTAAPTQAITEPTQELGVLITLPVPEPTAAPKAAPAPGYDPIVITKHPSSETVSTGGRTWFIAKAENATQITWEFFSPDGTEYSLQQAMSAHPGLVLEELPEDTLGLRQIPASFSGWSARARYEGPGGTAVTDRAEITVRDPYSEIIERYRTVRRSGSGNIEKGISELVNRDDFLGYTMADLDGNGVEELILASDNGGNYPNVIYEIYTLQNGTAVSVTRSAARQRYYLLDDGRFLMEGSSGAMYAHWITYNFRGASLSVQEQIWTSEEPHDMADFAPYYYYAIAFGEGDPLVYDEASQTIDSWERSVILPSLTAIS